MTDDELDRALRGWGRDELDRTPGTALPEFSSAGRRRPSRLVAIAAAAVFVLAVGVGVSILPGRNDGPGPSAGPAQPVAAGELVVRNGDTVSGQGVVLSLPGRPVRFCAPGVDFGVGGRDDRFDYCSLGIDVTGVDLSRLADRATRASDGAVYGMATLVGTYRRGTLSVTSQGKPGKIVPGSLPSDVPCSTPAGGWPRGGKFQDLDIGPASRYQHAHPGTIKQIAELRPSDDQVVAYVLTTGDPAPVIAALRPDFGERLCVVRSRWTTTQLAQARRVIKQAFDRSVPSSLNTPTSASFDGLGPDAQIQLNVQVPIMSRAFATKLDRSPLGLIDVGVWLGPQR